MLVITAQFLSISVTMQLIWGGLFMLEICADISDCNSAKKS